MPLTTPEECSFCRKLNGVERWPEADIVWRFPHSLAVLGTWQFYHGYCLLVSRHHAEELSQLTPATRRAFLEEMCVLAQALEAEFRPRKLNYELLGNQVPHLHWHLFPRYDHDPDHLKPVWVALERRHTSGEGDEFYRHGPCPREVTVRRIGARLEMLGAPALAG